VGHPPPPSPRCSPSRIRAGSEIHLRSRELSKPPEPQRRNWQPNLQQSQEQENLRLFTNLIEVKPAAVSIGMAVAVRFEDHGEVFVPMFAPA
jgi:hypothetical protein